MEKVKTATGTRKDIRSIAYIMAFTLGLLLIIAGAVMSTPRTRNCGSTAASCVFSSGHDH